MAGGPSPHPHPSRGPRRPTHWPTRRTSALCPKPGSRWSNSWMVAQPVRVGQNLCSMWRGPLIPGCRVSPQPQFPQELPPDPVPPEKLLPCSYLPSAPLTLNWALAGCRPRELGRRLLSQPPSSQCPRHAWSAGERLMVSLRVEIPVWKVTSLPSLLFLCPQTLCPLTWMNGGHSSSWLESPTVHSGCLRMNAATEDCLPYPPCGLAGCQPHLKCQHLDFCTCCSLLVSCSKLPGARGQTCLTSILLTVPRDQPLGLARKSSRLIKLRNCPLGMSLLWRLYGVVWFFLPSSSPYPWTPGPAQLPLVAESPLVLLGQRGL